MSFDVTAEHYERFMGRYSRPLAPLFAAFAELDRSHRVLDVGCGSGSLTDHVVGVVGGGRVAALDPSASFVEVIRTRHPDVDVREGAAETLPYTDGMFDRALASLVVHFMRDAVQGVREMARVTAAGGVVAACVWDHEGGGGPLSQFWEAARELDPGAPGEAQLAGTRQGDLRGLFEAAGLTEVVEDALVVHVEHPTFAEWWEPYTFGVGPAGAYVASLEPEAREALRAHCEHVLPSGPFTISGKAWAAKGRVQLRSGT